MTTFRRVLLGAALSVIASGFAGATTLTQTFTLSSTQTDIADPTGTGTFNDFLTQCPTCDASWLNSVQIQISVNETVSVLLTNTSLSSNTFEYQTYSDLGVVATGAPVGAGDDVTLLNAYNQPNFSAGNSCVAVSGVAGHPSNINLCDTGNVTYTAGQAINYGPHTAGSTTNLVNSGNISPYDTAGTFTLGFTTKTHQSFSGGGGLDSNSQSTTAAGTITVLYNYTELPPPSSVPEPATLFLMGSALVGIGLFRKRIKS